MYYRRLFHHHHISPYQNFVGKLQAQINRQQYIYKNKINEFRYFTNDCKHVFSTHRNDINNNNNNSTTNTNDNKQRVNNNSTKAAITAENKSNDDDQNRMEKNCLSFNEIPTATGRLPFFGNKLSFLLSGSWNRFHKYIDNRHRQLGPIFREPLGSIEAVFIQSPDLLRDIFNYEGKYPKHPLPEAWTFYNQLHNCKRGLFFMDDDEWLNTRKQLAPLMLRNEERFLWAIEIASDQLIGEWQRNANSEHFLEIPNALTTLYHWSITVLIGIMFGSASTKILNDLKPLIEHFAYIVQNVFEDTVPFMTVSPQLARRFNLNIWNKFEQSVTETLTIANQIIDYGLNVRQYDGLLSDMQQLNVTELMIKRIFVDLIIAAGDTTAFSTQWALYLLSKDFEMQQQVRDEVLKASTPHDTPLIRGTVREALRMYPVATFVGRILEKDAILNNYKIDKHTLVLISMYSAGRDELSFPQANRFLPWRWNRDSITGSLKYVNHPQSTIPYALGARNCIGQRIANSQMQVILSKLLKTFELKLLNENEIDIIMRLIIMPNKKLRFGIKSLK